MHGVDDPAVERSVRAYVKLMRASRAVLARVEKQLAECCGLTLTQLGVLEAVLHKGPQSQRALGRLVLTSAGNMTDVIDKLEARGLVHRAHVPGDRRSLRIELTAGSMRRSWRRSIHCCAGSAMGRPAPPPLRRRRRDPIWRLSFNIEQSGAEP